MAKQPKLKVYRTPIGFHDAYVAAPSQKTALEAWGSDKNLFARGLAEIVEDAALTAAPLAAPGTVIKRLRGTTAEQIAALSADRPKAKKAARSEDEPAPTVRTSLGKTRAKATPRPPKPKPRPSREALDSAEQALDAAKTAHEQRLRDLAEREAALAHERRAMETSAEDEASRLRRARDKAAAAYDAAMTRCRG